MDWFVSATAAVKFSMWMLHHFVMVRMIYVNLLVVDYAVREWWLVWQMDHGCAYCCYVHLVIDISLVFVHYGFSVGYHSMRYDGWIETVMWWHLDYRCHRCHHYTGMFHIHSMSMSVADDHDYSNQRFVLSVANGNVDAADCKLVHIDFGWDSLFASCKWFTIYQLEFL